jgi:hypothetical protein
MSSENELDLADRKRPATNTPIDIKNSFLVGKRFIKNGVAGIIIPIASEYALVSHCPTEGVILNSTIITGRIVLSAV